MSLPSPQTDDPRSARRLRNARHRDPTVRKQLSVPLPAGQWRALRDEAARRRVSMAELCRRWLRPELDRAGRGYVWDTRPLSWARLACAVAGRTLTRSEWQDALPNRPYTPACRRG